MKFMERVVLSLRVTEAAPPTHVCGDDDNEVHTGLAVLFGYPHRSISLDHSFEATAQQAGNHVFRQTPAAGPPSLTLRRGASFRKFATLTNES